MQTIRIFAAVVLLTLVGADASEKAKLERGTHGIDTPVRSDGLCVHNLFQSGMVIQRDTPAPVWGWAAAGEAVSVSFAGETHTATADRDHRWRVVLPARPANREPQTLTITGKAASLSFDNILVGDVWIAGGQSNMQHPLSNVEGGRMEIISAHFPEIRLLTVPAMIDNAEKANFPRIYRSEGNGHHREGFWDVCSPGTVSSFSAIGYVFARRLHMASQVPIGVIDASRWGTTVEAWTPRAVLRGMDAPTVKAALSEWDQKVSDYDPPKALEGRIASYNARTKRLQEQGQDVSGRTPPTVAPPSPIVNQNHPGNCYASMIAPLAGAAVKGAIYHQGFNNSRADAAEFYYAVFPKMIAAWRAAFNDPAMPFGIISLCTDGTPQTLDNYTESMMNNGIYVREAQYKTFLDLYSAGDANIGFASSFDLRRAWYHPQDKIPAGERIARWALATQYGFEGRVRWKPPMVTKMELEGGTIRLHIDKDVGSVDSQAITGFAIAGEDKTFQPAKAECLVIGEDGRGRPQRNRKILVLSSPHVPRPVHFRYAWSRNPMGNLRVASTEQKHIPFATQRSDSWAFWEVPFLKPPADKGASRSSVAQIRNALRLVDQERRVKDAERFLNEHREDFTKEMDAFLGAQGTDK